jgi:hypothetical protein
MRMWAVALGLALLAGCQDDKPSDIRQRQDAALNDPYNYSPFHDQKPDISGGGFTDFKSSAFKRDYNSVFNP